MYRESTAALLVGQKTQKTGNKLNAHQWGMAENLWYYPKENCFSIHNTSDTNHRKLVQTLEAKAQSHKIVPSCRCQLSPVLLTIQL